MIQLALGAIDPDADVLDVGANIGFFTVAIGRRLRNGRILAVEPSSNTAERLQQNISLNGLDNRAVVFEGAAADAPGSMTLNYVDGQEEYSSLGNLDHPAIAKAKKQSEEVRVDTIDNLVQQFGLKPRFMKVDVEGFEHAVFKGARETLREFRPTILSEMSPNLLAGNGSSADEVIGLILEAGYTVKDTLYPDLAPGQRPLGDHLSTDWLAALLRRLSPFARRRRFGVVPASIVIDQEPRGRADR
nr:FkbM family methyltransferase [Bradyrhizobium sp. IC3123]